MTPLEFFGEVIPISKKIQFKLGYFSSNSISTLHYGFAEFIYNGGTIDFLINHFVSNDDYNLINNKIEKDEDFYNRIEKEIIKDLSALNDTLSKKKVLHFYNCLRYLIDNERLNIIPVTTSTNEISHYKEALFWDESDNILNIVGSCNFTQNGIISNGESFKISRSWGEISETSTIKEEEDDYKIIFKKKSKDFIYLNPKKLKSVILENSKKKKIENLFEEELELLELEQLSHKESKFKKILENQKLKLYNKIELINNTPKFPFDKPRDYQILAYQEWKKNNCQGIFAMATGTGKTLTSLNAVLEEYKINGYYNAIILVPTQILVNQWINECKKFNFKNIFSTYDKNWDDKLKKNHLEKRLGVNSNFIFISTYASFNGKKFQKIFKDFNCKDTILIADEAHNLGTKRSISNYLLGIHKRIGLSATPKRNFDESGTYEIEKYFNSFSPNHTFSYSMLKAIKSGFLTPYYYYPKFIKLNESEMEAYAEYSEKLLKFFDFEKGTYKEEASNLLIQRKRIIHQASNKKNKLVEIINEINYDDFKHTIVYVPEGFEPDYSQSDASIIDDVDLRIIDDYNTTIKDLGIKTHQIVGGMNMDVRENILEQFNDGVIQVLTAMKTLDEGVDIPATKCAVFCASTGNPRQFIQRRGRILRNFEGKEFATVYDLIIEPNDISYWNLYPKDKREKLQKMEINIFRNELFRVANFLYASENLSDLHLKRNTDIKKLINLTEIYKLDIFSEINKLIELDNQ